jgi:hypothetical protein
VAEGNPSTTRRVIGTGNQHYRCALTRSIGAQSEAADQFLSSSDATSQDGAPICADRKASYGIISREKNACEHGATTAGGQSGPTPTTFSRHEAPRRASSLGERTRLTRRRTHGRSRNGQQSECDAAHADRVQAERHREDNGHTDALVRATDRDMDLLTIIDACTQPVN